MSLRRAMSAGEASFHKELTPQDRAELLRLCTLQELPKARYATKIAITALPARRTRKIIYSHVEVYKMVEQVATAMREAGVRPHTVCAMVLENSVEAIIYFLAAVWIGAIAAPVDTQLSLEDTVHVLKSVKAATVVSALIDEDEQEDNALFKKVKDACQQLQLIEWHIKRTTNNGVELEMHGTRAAEGAAWKGGAGDFTPDDDQIAVHNASVSEKTSLVVPLTHGNFAAAIRTFVDTYQISADDTTILTRPWFTADGLLAILSTVYSGGHIVVPGTTQNPDKDFLKVCADYGVDWFTEDPNFLASLCEVAKNDSDAFKAVEFTFIRSVAGNLDESTLDAMDGILGAPVLEAYGTPETCGMISCNVETGFKPGTKGRPPSDVTVRIFNEMKREVEGPNVEGLIGVAGDNVSSGYLDNEDANDRVLLHESKSDGSTTTFFLTGDRGAFDGEGFLKVWERNVTGRAEAFAQEVRERAEKEHAEAVKKEHEAREAAEQEVEEARQKEEDEEAKKRDEERERAEKEKEEAERKETEAREASEKEAEEARLKEEEEVKKREEERLIEEAKKLDQQKEQSTSADDSSNTGSFHSAFKSESERASVCAREATSPANSSVRNVDDSDSGVEIQSRGSSTIANAWIRKEEDSDGSMTDAKSWIRKRAKSDSGLDVSVDVVQSAEVSSASGLDISPRDITITNRAKVQDKEVVIEYVQQPPVYIHDVDPNILDEIVTRLGVIEENQRKLEFEMEEAHRREMESMKQLLKETQDAYARNPPTAPIPVNLDDVNLAINRATQSAQASKENTEKAVKAANEATAAAERAVAQFSTQPLSMVKGPSNMVEVKEPGTVHKTVMVSLDEVETAIKLHPSVANARAFGRPDKRYGMEVFCVILAKVGARVSEPWLKLHAQSVLPAACVPKRFFVNDQLTVEHDREELAKDKTLKRVSALSGYTAKKVIKSPTWMPANREAEV